MLFDAIFLRACDSPRASSKRPRESRHWLVWPGGGVIMRVTVSTPEKEQESIKYFMCALLLEQLY